MKNNLKNKTEIFLLKLVYYGIPILTFLILIGYCILCCYCFFAYGNKPITEVPSWVWWIMHTGGKQ